MTDSARILIVLDVASLGCRHRLICIFVVGIRHKQVFSRCGSNHKSIFVPTLYICAIRFVCWFCCLTSPSTSMVMFRCQLGPVKRICVFEQFVMTNFNCACPAIQRGQGSGFLSEDSSRLTAYMSEQRRFWRDCADAQARLNLRCSYRR